MARIALALMLLGVFGTASPAQDRAYEGRRVEVKDPATFVAAQDRPLFSGPQPGEALPDFEMIGVAGERDGKTVNPVAIAGESPQLLIFQGGIEGLRSVLALTRFLPTIAEESGSTLVVTVVLMDDDRNASEEMAGRIAPYLGETVVLGYTTDGRDGPGVYGLNRNVAQTILFAKGGMVTRSFAFPQGGIYADPHVLGAIAELLEVDRDTFGTWIAKAQAQEEQRRVRNRR
ncbi:hypothetical protein [Tautonia rosea]|uniref:hypothetical protein n=1 Tax=Tautonia rosea TaxID=2728037 RepID=UPI00147630B8|nr:hypothetical protein [Tautonia rosea]